MRDGVTYQDAMVSNAPRCNAERERKNEKLEATLKLRWRRFQRPKAAAKGANSKYKSTAYGGDAELRLVLAGFGASFEAWCRGADADGTMKIHRHPLKCGTTTCMFAVSPAKCASLSKGGPRSRIRMAVSRAKWPLV